MGKRCRDMGKGPGDMGKKVQRYGEGVQDMGADGLRTKVKFFYLTYFTFGFTCLCLPSSLRYALEGPRRGRQT